MWLNDADLDREREDARNKAGYIGKELRQDLESLVQCTRAITMREIGGHLMNAYEQTDKRFKTLDSGRERSLVEGELRALKTVMEFLSGWSDKVMAEQSKNSKKSEEEDG